MNFAFTDEQLKAALADLIAKAGGHQLAQLRLHDALIIMQFLKSEAATALRQASHAAPTKESPMQELPQYKCHKTVRAAKIAELKPRHPDDGTLLLTPDDVRYAPFILDSGFVAKHNPQVGGYYVVYDGDGYASYSPAKAFEEGYTLVKAGEPGCANPALAKPADDASIEAQIQAKGLTAPRVTPADIEAAIVSQHYFTAYGGAKYGRITRDEPNGSEALKLLTFCVLVLRNGFTVTGESACASPENFDPEIGRQNARQNAVQKIWMLEGYLLKQRLFAASHIPA